MKNEKQLNKITIVSVNADQNAIFCEDAIDTEIKDLKELKKYLKAANRGGKNKKLSKIFRDGPDGQPVHVGFSVSYKDKYDDGSGFYPREDWVELLLAIEVTRPRIEFLSFNEIKGLKNEKSKKLPKKPH